MYELPENVRAALIEYLAAKPWREVANVMPVLQGLKRVEPKAKRNKPQKADGE
jgi:hypothetical protein